MPVMSITSRWRGITGRKNNPLLTRSLSRQDTGHFKLQTARRAYRTGVALELRTATQSRGRYDSTRNHAAHLYQSQILKTARRKRFLRGNTCMNYQVFFSTTPQKSRLAPDSATALSPRVRLRRGMTVTDSLAIAREFKRLHKNVLATLDSLIADSSISRLDFKPAKYLDTQGKQRRAMELTERGALIAMPFIGARIRVLDRFGWWMPSCNCANRPSKSTLKHGKASVSTSRLRNRKSRYLNPRRNSRLAYIQSRFYAEAA